MISFQAHGDHHWYQSLTATAAAGSLNPLGTMPLRDEHGKASFARAESPFNGTAVRQAAAAQPAGDAKGFPRVSTPPTDPRPFPQHHVYAPQTAPSAPWALGAAPRAPVQPQGPYPASVSS